MIISPLEKINAKIRKIVSQIPWNTPLKNIGVRKKL